MELRRTDQDEATTECKQKKKEGNKRWDCIYTPDTYSPSQPDIRILTALQSVNRVLCHEDSTPPNDADLTASPATEFVRHQPM